LIRGVNESSAALRMLRDDGYPTPYPILPESGGLMKWAHTGNGESLYWLEIDGIQHVVVEDFRSPEWCDFEYSISGFLVALLNKSVLVDLFPDEWPPSQHTFTWPTD